MGFLCDQVNRRDGILSGIKKQQDDGVSMKSPTIALLASVVYAAEQVCFVLIILMPGRNDMMFNLFRISTMRCAA